MGNTHTPPDNHEQFDAICAQLEEWEALPTVTPRPVQPDDDVADDEQPLDGLILAGLVSPY